MTKEELKNKYTEREKIFQQAMENCKSSSPMDCWTSYNCNYFGSIYVGRLFN